MCLPGVTRANSALGTAEVADNNSAPREVTMSALDAMKMVGAMVDNGELDMAEQILDKMPAFGGGPLEIERWFLTARIAAYKGDFDTAIDIYRDILDAHPDLARVRFELAVCYMKTKQWYRADYQLRLAMAGNDLPDNIRQMMNYYRYVIRQNKNWNVWFNFGAAPDNNVNNATGGQECVMTPLGPLCHNLVEPESAVGFNLAFGGNYEFKLSEQWRWKTEAGIYSNTYTLHNYDDLYLYASTGPRFIWSQGDVWIAAVGSRRWYGWDGYNWSAGGRVGASYDFTRKLLGRLDFQITSNKYDVYAEYLNGETYSLNTELFYSISPNFYTVLRTGVAREWAASETYSYWTPRVSIGIGAELPWGFNLYVEPAFYWQLYDGEQWSVQDGWFKRVTERDFSQRYAVYLSNNKFDVMGFVPTVVFSYTRRDSNIWQREYDRWAVEFTMSQRF